MNEAIDKILNNISHQILPLQSSNHDDLYKQRLIFLYSVPLSNLLNGKYDELLSSFINEIKVFEQMELKNTLLFLEDFWQITPEVALQIFSIVSYDLAKWRLHGSLFLHLSYLLEELYLGLISSNVASYDDNSNYEMLISETLLDFDFANCKSENTSLRLLHYINSL